MYLEIFVIAAFACVGVVRGEEDAQFMCPECQVVGEVSDCDANIRNKPCYKDDPVCGLLSSHHSSHYEQQIYTQRFCAERGHYLWLEEQCENSIVCTTAMCDTSGCMAELAEAPFMCPSCEVAGGVSDCDAEIKNKSCYKEDPVCVVASVRNGPQIYTYRRCFRRELYLRLKESCESGNCAIAMCDTSGCMAEFSSA